MERSGRSGDRPVRARDGLQESAKSAGRELRRLELELFGPTGMGGVAMERSSGLVLPRSGKGVMGIEGRGYGSITRTSSTYRYSPYSTLLHHGRT